MKILFIDNFDSFSYNLVDEFEKRGHQVLVYRNDISMAVLQQLVDTECPALLVISPGPSTPANAGICIEAVRNMAGKLTVFGVCLGHQVIIEAFGGEVDRAPVPVHGKVGHIRHDGKGIFREVAYPMAVGRYHSLVGVEIPAELEASAHCGDLVMAVRHRKLPVVGVQFHPESILTASGGLLVENLLASAEKG